MQSQYEASLLSRESSILRMREELSPNLGDERGQAAAV
jgi:hypothetical protein